MKTTRRGALQAALGVALAGVGAPARAFGQAWARGGQISASPNALPSLPDYERLAREAMSDQAYAFVAGGAGDEIILRANREAYDRIVLDPTVLVDVSRLDTRVTLFGRELPFPILLAPTGYHRLLQPKARSEPHGERPPRARSWSSALLPPRPSRPSPPRPGARCGSSSTSSQTAGSPESSCAASKRPVARRCA